MLAIPPFLPMHRHTAQSVGDISSSLLRVSGSRRFISTSSSWRQKTSPALRQPRSLPPEHGTLHTDENVDRNVGPNKKKSHKNLSVRGEEKSSSSSWREKTTSALRQPRSLPPQHYDILHKLTDEVVDRNAGPNTKRWHKTPSLRGEEKTLTKAVQKSTSPSMEQTKFALGVDPDEAHDELGSSSSDFVLAPGTFVEVRR
jgi:hypothetical protein